MFGLPVWAGVLVLVGAILAVELAFVRLTPRSMLRIARARIAAVETTPGHLGRKARRALLRIAFRDEAGGPDVVGFHAGRHTRPREEALAAG